MDLGIATRTLPTKLPIIKEHLVMLLLFARLLYPFIPLTQTDIVSILAAFLLSNFLEHAHLVGVLVQVGLETVVQEGKVNIVGTKVLIVLGLVLLNLCFGLVQLLFQDGNGIILNLTSR